MMKTEEEKHRATVWHRSKQNYAFMLEAQRFWGEMEQMEKQHILH
jgi:hypothetical protein